MEPRQERVVSLGATPDVTVRLQTLNGTWETCGADRAIGVVPESLKASASGWGYDKASFDLHRSVIALWPDLSAYTPIEVEIGGVVIWEGRTNDTPMHGAEQVVNVQCEGWQYNLDDDTYSRAYVHSKLSDWRDARSFLGTVLAGNFVSAPQVGVTQGAITLGWGAGSTVAVGNTAGVMLDLGPSGTARRIVVELDRNTVTDAEIRMYVRGANQENCFSEFTDAVSNVVVATGGGLYAGTLAFDCRYVSIFLYYAGGGGPSSEQTARIKKVYVFAEAAYEGGNVSQLKASTIVRDALEQTTNLLSTDYTQISTTSFAIADFVLSKSSSARKAIEAANAYHNWITKVGRNMRFTFAARPTAPLLEIGAWAGSDFDDTSANSGGEIFNRAIVEATGPDGSALAVARESTNSIVSRRVFRRTELVQVSSALTSAAAAQITEVFLAAHSTTPFKGEASVTAGGVRMVLGGQPVPPYVLLAHTQELLRVSHLTDPDTGGLGRDGTIAEVTYTHKDQTAVIVLDDKRGNFEALLSRLEVVQNVGA
jgi:hypothetical protein